ncbi:MAG: hypothetical protein K6G88_14205 [Lachnospiraceae bacterium]|jgi:hypothetical protein|nr:hypothetical protein [Lachnospiraceae bacterium]
MDYENVIWRLELTNEPLGIEAAKVIRELYEENMQLHEGYEAMFRDLKYEINKNRYGTSANVSF